MTDWKTWHFFFFFNPEAGGRRHVRFESVTALFSMKNGTWFLDEQFDTGRNTELKKSVVHIFSCIFWQESSLKTERKKKKKKKKEKRKKKKRKEEKKKRQAKKSESLNFAESNAPKNKCAQQLWDIKFIFFSLLRSKFSFSYTKDHVRRNSLFRDVSDIRVLTIRVSAFTYGYRNSDNECEELDI